VMADTVGTTALDAARESLRARVNELEEQDELWRERMVIEPLYHLADHVCRVGDHDTPHYRADKAGPLVTSAIRVRRAAFENYAASEPEGYGHFDTEAAEGAIEELTSRELKVDGLVNSLLWDIARGAVPDSGDLRDLKAAAKHLIEWVDAR
jgi:hypothetical protein